MQEVCPLYSVPCSSSLTRELQSSKDIEQEKFDSYFEYLESFDIIVRRYDDLLVPEGYYPFLVTHNNDPGYIYKVTFRVIAKQLYDLEPDVKKVTVYGIMTMSWNKPILEEA